MASVTGITAEYAEAELDKMIVRMEVNQVTGVLYAYPRRGDPIAAGPAIAPAAAVEKVYPIGTIYTNSSTAANPATYLGIGTWIRFGKGRTIVSLDEAQVEFDQIEEVGGVKAVTLTDNQSGMPNHAHNVSGSAFTSTNAIGANFTLVEATTNPDSAGAIKRGASASRVGTTIDGSDHRHSVAININSSAAAANAAEAHSNLQPYIIAYVWKRTA